MADNVVFYGADWWEPEGDDGGERTALEVERTDADEVVVNVRGLSGGDDAGAIYVTVENARRIAAALKAEADADWPEPS